MGIVESLLKDKNEIESKLSKIQKQKAEIEHNIKLIQVKHGTLTANYRERCVNYHINENGGMRFFHFMILFPPERLRLMNEIEQKKLLSYWHLDSFIEFLDKNLQGGESPPIMSDSDKKEIAKLQRELKNLEE